MAESLYETIFDSNCDQDWQLLKKGWPDRIVRCGDKIFCVEIKQGTPESQLGKSREPLRPDQAKMLAWLEEAGIDCFVAPDGDAKHLVPWDQWPQAAYAKGRPPAEYTISRSTKRQYGYKKLKLENQMHLARTQPSFPRELLSQMEEKLKQIDRKIDEYDAMEQATSQLDDTEQARAARERADTAFRAGQRMIDQLSDNVLEDLERYMKEENAKLLAEKEAAVQAGTGASAGDEQAGGADSKVAPNK